MKGNEKTRYAQVGIGGRSLMYTQAIATTFKGEAELVGMCDANPGRLEERHKLWTGQWKRPAVRLLRSQAILAPSVRMVCKPSGSRRASPDSKPKIMFQ